MFTEAQKDDIRRFCGMGVWGKSVEASPPSFGYRYYETEETLEYRMNNLSLAQEQLVEDVYLARLRKMETDIVDSSENLDTDRAAVWYHNKNEVADRFKLFNSWRLRLCDFFRIDMQGRSGTGIRIVV